MREEKGWEETNEGKGGARHARKVVHGGIREEGGEARSGGMMS